ncbi:MAG: nucleotidyltransferase [Alphaproteobacteria bacterium]
MAIGEDQLETWTRIGAGATSKATYTTIKSALERADAPYSDKSYSIYLQGSYGNDTNVFRDSDVDVVICTNSIFYSDTSNLSGEALVRYNTNRIEATYSAAEFKSQVLVHLRSQFGQAVEAGNKAIFIPGDGVRRDADVLACAQYRRYFQFTDGGPQDYHEGVCFFLPDGTLIENYPKMHLANCTTKHQATNSWFKPTARLYKNMRNRMIEQGRIGEGIAPSYFVEGLLYNVPPDRFGGSYAANFTDTLNWLHAADRSNFVCANERFYLLREGSKVTWRAASCVTFLNALVEFWNSGG